MNAEVKEKWIEALTSGKYVQGKGRLKVPEDNTYCCLGVLCDLYIQTNVVPEDVVKVWNDEGILFYVKGYPPEEVLKWAGLASRRDGDAIREWTKLATMNDACNNTFEEIADYIKDNF